MKNVLFLDRNLTVNGTSVYYKNLTKSLSGAIKIYFFPFKRQAFYKEITAIANVIRWIPFFTRQYQIDTIYVCTAEMFILALFFKKYFFKKAQIVYSIFHPRQNFFEPNIFGGVYKKIIHQKMLECPDVFVFYNAATRQRHIEHYQLELKESRIFPVLVESLVAPREQSTQLKKADKVLRIVSLGRLVDFKYYHEAVIEAILAIKSERKIAIEYHIYGDGHLRHRLEQLIKREHASSFVFLHGHLGNEKLYECLTSADIFIGMGTSLMYAASLGVPSIMAIESSEFTYGFFTDDIAGYECGEDIAGIERTSYLNTIKAFIDYGNEERIQLKNKTLAKGKQFLLEDNLDDFLNVLGQSNKNKVTGLSWPVFLMVLVAKVGVKLLPKKVGDK
ncbi:MAG: glycosyltransferase [Gammaproteobacteria bacterium]|nr:glycosyltransferase [Gammaproteobacteria bacterium]